MSQQLLESKTETQTLVENVQMQAEAEEKSFGKRHDSILTLKTKKINELDAKFNSWKEILLEQSTN